MLVRVRPGVEEDCTFDLDSKPLFSRESGSWSRATRQPLARALTCLCSSNAPKYRNSPSKTRWQLLTPGSLLSRFMRLCLLLASMERNPCFRRRLRLQTNSPHISSPQILPPPIDVPICRVQCPYSIDCLLCFADTLHVLCLDSNDLCGCTVAVGGCFKR